MWNSGDAYERFMGRWSAVLAGELVGHVLTHQPKRDRWLDIGCGPGAATAAALAEGVAQVEAVEPSPAFAAAARERFRAHPVTVHDADATTLPPGPFDAATMNLVLNFTPDPVASLRAASAALADGGVAAVSVWELTSDESFLARFWAAADRVLGSRSTADERSRWRVCSREGLAEAAREAGWTGPVVPVVVPTVFADEDDLWEPFQLPVGPATVWLAEQPADVRAAIRETYVADVFGASGGKLPFPALMVTSRPR